MNSSFFSGNRERFVESLGGELAVLTGSTGMQWHGDTAQPFRQEANFWYLTGIEHPDWRLVIDGRQSRSWLIAPEVDATHQLFDGSLSHEDAKETSGVDEVLSQKAGEQLLQALAKKHNIVYALGVPPYAEYADFTLNPAPERLRKELKKLFGEVKDCQKELAKLRAIKQPQEVNAIEEAIAISVPAFKKVKTAITLNKYEYEIEAELGYHFRRRNATHAFEPIVASGKNACTLHYTANNGKLLPGNLLLIDAGARVNGYSADITRTYVTGEPTKYQRKVHEAVRTAEKQIIELIRPGVSLKDYITSVDEIMKEALLSLGLMKNKKDTTAYRRYFPHAISHGLGLDVHESLGGYKEFQPGMVLTVEPGIYIPEEGIGVRIEDDILVTETGYENLTAGLSTDL